MTHKIIPFLPGLVGPLFDPTILFSTGFSESDCYLPTGRVRTGWAPGTVPPTTAKRAVSIANVSRD